MTTPQPAGRIVLVTGARLITIERVRAEKPSTIWMSTSTCWWTHRREDLYRNPANGLPSDPRGGTLMESHDAEKWLSLSESMAKNGHYGRHGLKVLEAAHHGNVITSVGWPTCFATWPEYEALLEAMEVAP